MIKHLMEVVAGMPAVTFIFHFIGALKYSSGLFFILDYVKPVFFASVQEA